MIFLTGLALLIGPRLYQEAGFGVLDFLSAQMTDVEIKFLIDSQSK